MSLFGKVYYKLLQIWWDFTVPLRLKLLGVELESGVKFYGMPIVSMVPGSKIKIASGVVICSDSRFTALGVNHPAVIRALNAGSVIEIGQNTGISGGVICSAESVAIGSNCLIGANCTISDTDFHPIKPLGRRYNNNPEDIRSASVRIDDNVFLGTGTVVLKGVHVGDDSVIGAASVVVKSVPDGQVWAGAPARFIGGVSD